MTARFPAHVSDTLAQIEADGMMERERMTTAPQEARTSVGPHEVLNFCANTCMGLANLPRITEIAETFDALVMADDCDATGFIGSKGTGTPAHFGVDIDILTGTPGKARSII